ncbi:MAG: hypothetical protein HYX69_19290 [Planctomycetia bacterium]|nr:hypothetical protein [Planctomycetia bacterium]
MAKKRQNERARPEPDARARPRPALACAAIAALVVAAGVVRIAAARGELWLDEVFAIRLVEDYVQTPADVIFELKADNNHFLNSLQAWLVGPEGTTWAYRWPAVLAGTLTVLLAGCVQRTAGFATAIAAVALTASSFLLVQYSSEARGYGPLMFFAMLAYASLRESDRAPHIGWECLFALGSVLGFLAHPAFLNFYLAAQVWTWMPGAEPLPGARWQKFVFRTVLPAAFFVWLYWVNLRHMDVAGGNDRPYSEVIAETLSVAIGGPLGLPGAYAAAAIAVLLLAAGLWHALVQSRRQGVFYLCVILLVPALTLVLLRRQDIYPRYFLLSVLFSLLLWSDLLGAIYERAQPGRIAYGLLLAAFVVANGAHVAQLIAVGRSHYREAIALMDEQTPGPRIIVGSDHEFRNGLMLEYYNRFSRDPNRLDVQAAATAEGVPEWYLTHDMRLDAAPPATLRASTGARYRLVKHYPYSGLSGWHLGVYRRE